TRGAEWGIVRGHRARGSSDRRRGPVVDRPGPPTGGDRLGRRPRPRGSGAGHRGRASHARPGLRALRGAPSGSADGCTNTASARLAERVGMHREAQLRQDWWSKGEWTDTVIFAMLASD